MEFNIADLFESVVDAVPDRVALVCGDRRLTYRQLEERSNRAAHALGARGIGAGDHVGLYLQNGTEYVELMLGCFKLRAVPINVNFRYGAGELSYLCRDAEVKGLAFQRAAAPRVEEVAPGLPDLRFHLLVEDGSAIASTLPEASDYEAALSAASPKREFAPRSGDDLYVIYTGGTTGMPKGVMWRHEDAFFSCLMGANPMGPPCTRPEEVAEKAREKPSLGIMTAAPLIHGAAQLGTLIAFMQGAKAILTPRFDPELIWRTVEREKAMTLSLVGDAMARPLAEALAAPGADCDASSLLILSSAGAILSQSVKDALRARLPRLTILDNYGASETGSQGMDAGGVTPEGGIRFRMNERTAILDEQLRPIPPGSGRVGRVALRRHVPLGYFNDPEKTSRTFVTVDGERWVIPGDLARPEADGTCILLGRGSQCINSGGEKIFPEEVEGAVKDHPAVFDALVVGVPDERWGERVTAVVELRPGATAPGLEELATHCRHRIAGYKVPRAVHVVAEIRRSPAGKADYPWAKRVALEQEGSP